MEPQNTHFDDNRVQESVFDANPAGFAYFGDIFKEEEVTEETPVEE